MTTSEGYALRHIIDGPPPLSDTERAIAHGKLLLKALYADHPGEQRAARRAILLLLGMADGQFDGA